MAAHAFSASVTLSKELVESVPGLDGKIKANQAGSYPAAWSCANGCDWTKILGCAFWVDFTAKVIAQDTSNLPCERAAIAAGASASASADANKRQIRHGRLDVFGVFDKFVLPKDLSVQAQAATHDADLMAEIDADRVLVMKSPDKIAPANLLMVLRVLGMQCGEHVTALVAGKCATAVLKEDDKVKDLKVPARMYIDGATGDLEAKMVDKKAMMLLAIQRGALDISDYASLMHRTLYSSVNFSVFMTALHTMYRKEIHEVTDAISRIENSDKDLATFLDQNAFFVLGTRLLARDASALETFFRNERQRYEDAAKKCGWKPKAATAPGAGAAAITSADGAAPVVGTKRKGDAAQSDAKAAKKAKFQAKKKAAAAKRRAAAAQKAAAEANKDDKDKG